MNGAVGNILPLALVVALSPFPVIAEILLLFTAARIRNAGAFLVGFLVGLSALTAVMIVVAALTDFSSGSGGSTRETVLHLGLGVLLLFAAFRKFRNRPKPGETEPMPKWMDGITNFQPGKSLGVGLVLGAVNPKNIAMAVAAASVVAGAGLATAQQVLAGAIFVAVGCLGVLLPFLVALVAGDRATPILNSWKAWLQQHNNAIMTVLFLILGVVLLGQGIGGLSNS